MKTVLSTVLFFLSIEIINAQNLELLLPVHHKKDVKSIVFSSDNKYLLTASADNTVKLWEVRSGICFFDFNGHAESVNKAIFSDDDHYIATAGNDGSCFIIEVSTLKIIAHFKNSSSPVTDIDFFPGRSTLLINSLDGTLKEWDFLNQKVLHSYTHGFRFGAYTEFIQKTGLIMCVPLSEGTIIFLDTALNRDAILPISSAADTRIKNVKYLPGRKILVAATVTSNILGGNLVSKLVIYDFIRQKDTAFSISCYAFEIIENGRLLVTNIDGSIYSIDLDDMKLDVMHVGKDEGLFFSVVLHEAGILWINKNADRSYAAIQNRFTNQITKLFDLDFPYLFTLSNDKYFAAVVESNQIRILSLSSRNLLRPLNKKITGTISAITPHKEVLYTAGNTGIGKWDYKYNRFTILLKGKWDAVMARGSYLVAQAIVYPDFDMIPQSRLAVLRLDETNAEVPVPQGSFAGIYGDTLYVTDADTKQVIAYDLLHQKQLYARSIPCETDYICGVFEADNQNVLLVTAKGLAGNSPLDIIRLNLLSNEYSRLKTPLNLGLFPSQLFFLPDDSLLFASSPAFVALFDRDKVLYQKYHRSIGGGATPVDYAKNEQYLYAQFRQQSVKKNNDSIIYFTGIDSFVYKLNFVKWDYGKKKKSSAKIPEPIPFVKAHTDLVTFLSLNGNTMISCSRDNSAVISDVKTGAFKSLIGHSDNVLGGGFVNDSMLYTFSDDNTIRLWDVRSGSNKALLYSEDSTNLIILPDGTYGGSRSLALKLGFRNKSSIYSFDQFDLYYNRPDMILQVMGNKDTSLIQSYRRAYDKRIKKLGIDTGKFNARHSVPEADFQNRKAIRYEHTSEQISLTIKATDSSSTLDHFNIWINEVPLFGIKGISILHRNIQTFDTSINISLSQGENRIETSVTNVNGTESYRIPMYVKHIPTRPVKETVYFIGIGINQFTDSRRNLKWCVKDIRDLALKFKEKYGNNIVIDTLFDQSVTLANIQGLKQKLQTTNINDKVIIAYSGHGLLSKQFDYYLSSYNVNFKNPEENGIAYEEIENILDSIPARKKLLLLDACHSGEVDKDELLAIQQAKNKHAGKGLIMNRGSQEEIINTKTVGLQNSFELMQALFVNVGKGTGATIISAAGGVQFAQERDDLENGVFTFCLLEAMQQNSTIKVSDLKKYVGHRVAELTKGLQKPTTRNELKDFDWTVW